MTDGRPEAVSKGRDVEPSITVFLVVLTPVDTAVGLALLDRDLQGRRRSVGGTS